MKTGIIVKNYRAENNITLEEFAAKSRLNASYIAALEEASASDSKSDNEVIPSITAIKKIAAAIGRDFDEMFSTLDEEVELS